MSQELLLMKDIHKQFPGVYALKGVDFELRSGEVHGLLGENGAGKSTLIKILGGIYSVDKGEIFIEGKRANIENVKDAQNHGISIIHQELVLVPNMTIAENIFLGREPTRNMKLIDEDRMEDDAQELLDSFDVGIKSTTKIRDLSIANQQIVEIIKAISYNSKILVMDEPTSSISQREVSNLFDTIKRLKAKGVGIIYISHRMSEFNELSDRMTVLRDGEYIGTRVTRETNTEELINMMVGRELKSYYTRTYNDTNKTLMEVKNLCSHDKLRNISFNVKKGEILGFAGLVGAGRSEVMKCIFGMDTITSGEFWVENEKVEIKDPNDAMGHGIALVPENRREEALFPEQNVRFNITIKVLQEFIRGISINKNKEDEIANEYVKEISIKTPSLDQILGNLSGGNQQKVIISRWLATKPKLLILDEPTRGIDVGAKAEIYAIMNSLVSRGVSIIMVSSELPEIINMSDRVVVMANGRITGYLKREELTQEKIMHLATQEV